jgi:hypothetical protein
MTMTRRTLFHLPTAAAAFAYQDGTELPPRPAKSIIASPLSVGFETLDRRHFEPERTYTLLGNLGVKWARVQTGWSRCETRKGEYDFRWLDEIVDAIRDQGVQPWFNLSYGNKLYSPESPLVSAVGWVPVFSAEARQAWANFTKKLAEHFASRVKHWEIWNEPDIKVFWKPGEPSPQGYADLVAMTAPVIRAAVPNVTIVGGAFSGFGTGIDYIEKAFEAGLAPHIDRLSYHAYTPRPEAGYRARVQALKTLAQRYKPSLRLWQGETGAPAVPGGVGAMANLSWTEERQAKWLLRRVLTDLDMEVELSSYFHLVDLAGYAEAATGAEKRVAYFGLLRQDYTPRPSYRAYQSLCALFDAQTRRADFVAEIQAAALPPDSLVTIPFERKGAPLFVYWHPSDLMKDAALSTTGAGTFWSGMKTRLDRPVLIDPLSGRIASLNLTSTRGYWKASALPVTDSPLIITDRSAL